MVINHILFTGVPAWGHTRAFCILAARIVKERKDVAFTLILSPALLEQAEGEISSELGDGGSEEGRKRIRVLASVKPTTSDPFVIVGQAVESYPAACKLIIAGETITCAATGTVFEALPPPTVILIDFLEVELFKTTQELTAGKIPIMAWFTAHAPSIIHFIGPEYMGGMGDVEARNEAEAVRLGVSTEELGDKINTKLYRYTDGSTVKLPGMSEMYDYEFYPQKIPFEIPLASVYKGVQKLLKDCNGILTVSAHAWEGDAIEALREWFSASGKSLYAIGPLLPATFGTLGESHRGSDDVKDFLDLMLSQKGEKSVLLISFGTLFWPADTGYLEEVIDALIEKSFPFIISHAPHIAKLTDDIKQRVNQSGIGLISGWCPQQYVLNHPATGWFLSHCGYNSATEALGSGTPIIAWPFESDQPPTAHHLTDIGVAIELVEVRTGAYSSKPLRQNGKSAQGTRKAVGIEIRQVIDACRGVAGENLRKNAEAMKAKLKGTWVLGGSARTELNAFLKAYTSD